MDKTNLFLSFISKGIYLRKCETSKDDLLRLINMLRPMNTGHQLIRLGNNGDGGYLLPDDFDGVKACFSAGVADDSTLELDLANRGIQCFLADYSVDGPATENALFKFRKKFISSKDDPSCISMKEWITESHHPCTSSLDSILSVDIEGSEIELFLTNDASIFKGFRFIVMELHFLERITHKAFYDLYYLALQKLLCSFTVCHLHPNNCSIPVRRFGITIPPTLEITLINNNRITQDLLPVKQLPHPLDNANVLTKPDWTLSKHWFK
ncbi:MAG: hypothetical protein CBD15_001225 [Synechococcus sp. TMED155]|nr:MAG: hypothetical protein CBD15_001225 [Synechococcus sp. TMED155]